jgi:hypothetical protein
MTRVVDGMKLQTWFTALPALFLLVPLAACGEPTGLASPPLMARDSMEVAAPTAQETLATAFDVKVLGAFIGGPRHPERAEHADQWDIAVRERDGVLQFVPAGALGSMFRPGITQPIVGVGFHDLEEAPRGSGEFLTAEGVPIRTGALYVVRSREGAGFGACVQFSKLEVLSVETDPVRVRLRLATNANCFDVRLPTSA